MPLAQLKTDMQPGNSAPGSPPRSGPRRVSAGYFFVGLAIAATLYLFRAAFEPLALALLFGLLLSGPVEKLFIYGIPRGVSAFILIFAALGIMLASVDLLWAPAQQWYEAAPQTLKTIQAKIKPISSAIQHIEELGSASRSAAADLRGNANAYSLPAGAARADVRSEFLDVTRSFMVAMVACIVATLFLLTGGPPMVARMTVALVDDLHAFHVMQLIDQVRAAVGQFYLTTALLNFTLGGATAATMSIFGMPSPILWGALAFALNFVPYAGSAVVLSILSIVALVTFDHPAQIAAVVGSYLVLTTIGGQIVQPLLVGRRMAINPLVVFLALWFGGVFWGIVGVILAMPALLTLKVVAQNSRGGSRLRAFLGPNENGVIPKPLWKWLNIRRAN